MTEISMRDERGQLGIFWVLLAGAVALVVLTITLLLGMQLVGGMANSLGAVQEPTNKTAGPDPITGQAVEFEDTSGPTEVLEVFSVQDSRGYAIELTGADDSYYQSHEDVDLATDNLWSVSTWARVDTDAGTENMTAVSANGRVLIQYNGTEGNWTAWYYDDGSGDSFVLETNAEQPGNLSLVTVTANGTHLKLYRNTTLADTRSLSTSAVEDADLNASNWDGTLDETRVFDDATNDSEQADLYNNPVAPRPDRNRTARLMFDEGRGSTTAIFFTNTYADLSNHTWVSGLDGHELANGTDYELNQDNGTVTALAGGRIDGAPVVWIDYRYEALNDLGQTARNIGNAFSLFSTAVILIPGVAVLTVLIGALLGATQVLGTSDFKTIKGKR